jgi:hypothetical protein
MDEYGLCFAHNNMKALCCMFMRNWAILGSYKPTTCSRHNGGGRNATIGSTICFLMCGV